ncbi:IS3 family transposase [Alteromonas ponticola]|uniref:IS3 family transposase n=1 Tax=Alteromonas ponticola TaxID=2720613 RepID=A0ABX1R6D1_9ALTE|nr:IS3 family transposase [Alteromonas ponticola]
MRQARADIFDYIEGFYNPRRNHGANGGLPPIEYKEQYY